ncbi:hypothetical protein Mmc1_1664 [Magnetococcus marinus MC-1]|uniref:Uncharacterized protein n=1 Tax=Magnetococcus marinus (strain ATCC BAA-1437 / JCM 17883 / MC-1) TaxID=156889 RepID=A0L880_MAGMM|nr:hypothetical protein [Magnetococcus marinus]ABK44173.1 hypothetical protein Mmc1_1664 [Magnetococcus marinus MC-1]
MNRESVAMVTLDNYPKIHNWLAERFSGYRINVEAWVVAGFHQLPTSPTPAAVLLLERWIDTFLPERLRVQLVLDLDHGARASSMGCSLVHGAFSEEHLRT